MENTPPPTDPKVKSASTSEEPTPFMYLLNLVRIAVVAFVVIIAAVFILKDTGLLSGGVASSGMSPVAPVTQDTPVPSRPLVFGSSAGKTSAAFYRAYLEEQSICQAKAANIRSMVEKIDLSNTVDAAGNIYTSANLGGAQKALKLCAGYYARAVKHRLSLSTAGVDPTIVSYVDQITAFDQQSQDAYEAYSLDPTNRPRMLSTSGAQREKFFRESEPGLIASFESKYGIKLPTRLGILEQQSRAAIESSTRFPIDNGPRKLADTLTGVSLTNIMDGGKWTVEQGEFIDGKVLKSNPSVGGCVIEVEMAFRGIRSGRGCKVHAHLIAAEDPVLNMFWIYSVSDAR